MTTEHRIGTQEESQAEREEPLKGHVLDGTLLVQDFKPGRIPQGQKGDIQRPRARRDQADR